MAWATLNGDGVMEARVELPRVGAWVADLAVDNPQGYSGAVTLNLNGFQLQGWVRRGGVVADTTIVRVVGGQAGGFPTELTPLAYQAVPLQTALQDVLAGAGEALDPTSDPGVLQTQLALWLRRQGPASEAMSSLLLHAGSSWRVLPNGNTWVGPETWPTSQLQPADATLLRQDPSNGREIWFADTPSLLPGTTFNGQKVSTVEHTVKRDELRMVVWYE